MMYTLDQLNKMENAGMFPTYQQVNGYLLRMNFTHYYHSAKFTVQL